MRRVFQLVPFLDSGDAIGDHARHLAKALGPSHAGFIVDRAAPDAAAGVSAVSYRDAKVGPGDLLVYHAAHGSPMVEWLGRTEAELVVDYHGITPPGYVRAYDPGLAMALSRATIELESLSGRARLAIAHSEFTRGELEGLGFPVTATLPLLVDPARLQAPGNPALEARLGGGNRGHDLLFVSRMAPSKRIEDLMKVFAIYRRAWRPQARLFVVGRPDTGTYHQALRRFADRLGIEGIHLCGKVPDAELAAHYRCADAFVSMSEHEGFGLPWVEAMAFDVPVVAFAAGALPETVGGAGILMRHKDYEDMAAAIDLVLSDGALRSELVAAGRARVACFGRDRFESRVRELLGPLR